MPRVGRQLNALVGIALVIAMAFLAAVGSPVQAQENGGEAPGDQQNETVQIDPNATGDAADEPGGMEGAAGAPPPRTYTIRALEAGCPEGREFCWDLEALPIFPGETVKLFVDLSTAAAPHNMHVMAPVDQATQVETGVIQVMEFQIPENAKEPIEYVCDVHPDTMFGQFYPPEAWTTRLAGAGEHEDIPHLGVHFLAYWVGVIAFAILFIVYGITFFLFKYNETSETTDQWDRSGGEAQSPRLKNMANLLAVVIAAVAVVAIVFLAR